MATKKVKQPYQYEPLVTPSTWRDDEQRFSIRLTQIIDDLYQKYSALRQKTKNAGTSTPTDEPVDADTLNGKTADDFLAADGTAVNAEKLGGKAPEYYLPAVNLLVNSDFTNPVNRRGFVSGTIGGANLSIDRWYLQHGTALHLLDGCIGLSGFWDCWQTVGTDLRAGETYTFAVLAKGETGNETLMLLIDTTDASSSQTHFYNIGTDWQIYAITCTPSKNMEIGTVSVKIGVNTGNEQSTKTLIKWACLYEGSYTAETLPPYVQTHPRVENLKIGNPVQAYNLLDNSNFEIAQAGYSAYHGSTLYAADRWQANVYTGEIYQKTPAGLKVTSPTAYEGQIAQAFAVPNRLIGKTLTYAVRAVSDVGRLGMLAYCYDANGNLLQNNLIEKAFAELTTRVITFVVPENTAVIRCYINNRAADTFTVEWAALYEGEYTAETLPPYIPKGYAVEQAECRRYYREMKSLRLAPYNVGTNTRYYRVNIDPPMRENVAPTITLVGAGEMPLNSWTQTGATLTVFGTITNAEFTISASGSNSATNFRVMADIIKISSDL